MILILMMRNLKRRGRELLMANLMVTRDRYNRHAVQSQTHRHNNIIIYIKSVFQNCSWTLKLVVYSRYIKKENR